MILPPNVIVRDAKGGVEKDKLPRRVYRMDARH